MIMTSQAYKYLILNGIRDLPTALLAEVTNFIYFTRKKMAEPDTFMSEQYSLLLHQDLGLLDTDELSHLEAEFSDYDQLYPHE